MTRLYALLTATGTACPESVLTTAEYADPAARERVESAASRDGGPDAPVPGTWADVTDNNSIAAR